jgi:hypothetical protein
MHVDMGAGAVQQTIGQRPLSALAPAATSAAAANNRFQLIGNNINSNSHQLPPKALKPLAAPNPSSVGNCLAIAPPPASVSPTALSSHAAKRFHVTTCSNGNDVLESTIRRPHHMLLHTIQNPGPVCFLICVLGFIVSGS